MKKKNIETDFIKYIVDNYNSNPGSTASTNDNEKSTIDQDEDDETTLERLLLEYKKIRDEHEYYSLQSKRG